MALQQPSTPVLITSNPEGSSSQRLVRLDLTASSGEYDESLIRDLIFEHPVALPIEEIDLTYSGLVSVCTEL